MPVAAAELPHSHSLSNCFLPNISFVMESQEIQEIARKVESIDVNEEEDGENPWQEQAAQTQVSLHRLQTPDPRELEQELASIQPSSVADPSNNIKDEEAKGRRTSAEVLEQFDPLANSVELNAKAALASAEGHLPPKSQRKSLEDTDWPSRPDSSSAHQSASPTPKPSPDEMNASPSLAFPSLASFAKSFSLPSKARSRSVDAKAEPSVLSPNTISSFATQQQVKSSIDLSKGKETQSTTAPPASGSSSGGDDSPSFDFQKFLDQIKSRSAEPVAKYLRSCVQAFYSRELYPVIIWVTSKVSWGTSQSVH